MTFEGLTRQSFWVGEDCSGRHVVRRDACRNWENWCNRPRHRPDRVELAPVTADNRRAVGNLVTHKSQERFVSPMLGNFRDALVPPPAEQCAPGALVSGHRRRRGDRRLHPGGGDDASTSESLPLPVAGRPDAPAARASARLLSTSSSRGAGKPGSDCHRGVVGRGTGFTSTHVPGSRV